MAAIVQAQCAVRIAPVASSKASGRVSLKAGFSGKAVKAQSVSFTSARRAERLVVKAEDATAPAKAAPKEEEPWTAPKLNPNTPSPIFGGSTGGLLRKAQVRRSAIIGRDFFTLAGNGRPTKRAEGEKNHGKQVAGDRVWTKTRWQGGRGRAGIHATTRRAGGDARFKAFAFERVAAWRPVAGAGFRGTVLAGHESNTTLGGACSGGGPIVVNSTALHASTVAQNEPDPFPVPARPRSHRLRSSTCSPGRRPRR